MKRYSLKLIYNLLVRCHFATGSCDVPSAGTSFATCTCDNVGCTFVPTAIAQEQTSSSCSLEWGHNTSSRLAVDQVQLRLLIDQSLLRLLHSLAINPPRKKPKTCSRCSNFDSLGKPDQNSTSLRPLNRTIQISEHQCSPFPNPPPKKNKD